MSDLHLHQPFGHGVKLSKEAWTVGIAGIREDLVVKLYPEALPHVKLEVL